MFKGKDGGSTGSELNESSVFRVQESGNLFKKPAYRDYVDSLEKIINIPNEHYQKLYQSLLYQYAAFTQSLQVAGDPQRTLELHRSMRRSYGFIKSCAPKVVANNGFGFDIDRLIYALYSAALLTGVGRVFQDRQVVICKRSGEYERTHYPILGLMTGNFYKVRAIKSQQEDAVALHHLMYAQVITPGVGLAWIMEDPGLFRWWASALVDFQTGFSELEIDFDLEKYAKGVGEDLNFDFDEVVHQPVETLEGERFLAWLKEQLTQDASLINKDGSGLHHVEGALLVEIDKWIEKYIESERSGRVSANNIKSQFVKLGVSSGVLKCSKSLSSGYFGQLSKSEFDAVSIEYEKGLVESGSLGPVVQIAQNGQLVSSERLFSRVGGAAQQFSIGQTPHSK